LTGVDDPYEPPATPELHLRTDRQDVRACLSDIVAELERSGRI
jgi:adenylylsulfate kinase-like enzyme